MNNFEEEQRLELEIEKLKLELQKKDNASDEHIKILCSKMETNTLHTKMEINTLHTKIDNMEKQITELHNKLCVAPQNRHRISRTAGHIGPPSPANQPRNNGIGEGVRIRNTTYE